MPYKTILEEKWETKGEKGYTRVEVIFGTRVHKDNDVVIRQSLTNVNKKFNAVVLFPSYNVIREIIQLLAQHHGKEEVEQALGIKIEGGDINGR